MIKLLGFLIEPFILPAQIAGTLLLGTGLVAGLYHLLLWVPL